MKKGFTLIELLAVTIILGVILAISLPKVLSIIDNSKMKTHKENIKTIISKSEQYIVDNFNTRPKLIGDTIEVKLSDLINNDYISIIKSPFNSNECKGYVLVTKIDEVNYEYIPNINCYNDIKSSAEDKLILDYNFDDFQEPTVNLLSSPYENEGNHTAYKNLFLENINKNVKENEEYILSGEYFRSHLHSGRIFAMLRLEDANGNMIPGDANLVPGWKSMETEPLYKYFQSDIEKKAIDNWYFYTLPVIKIPPGYNNGKIEWIKNVLTSGGTADEITKIRNVQFEQKSYPTPFVDGIREGIIKDSSLNKNHSNLDLTTTPKWIFDEERKSGVYEFNGINNSINTNYNLSWNDNNNITISFWMKPKNINASNSALFGKKHNSFEWVILQEKKRIDLVYWNNVGAHTNGMDFNTTDVLSENEWTNVVYIWDGIKSSFYIDGKFNVSKTSVNSSINKSNVAPLMIGGNIYGRGALNSHFNGLIDDVKIYNRALNSDEIKFIYENTK